MDSKVLINITEMTLVIIGALTLIKKAPTFKIKYNDALLFLAFIFIIFVACYATNGNYFVGFLKVIMCLCIVCFSYQFSRYSPYLLMVFLVYYSLQNFIISGTLNKFSYIPISFIAFLIYSIHSEGDKVKYALCIFVCLDLLQSLYTHYRGQVLFCSLSLICLLFNFSLKKNLPLVFISFSLGYLAIIYISGLYFFLYQEQILSATYSNIERSSMIYWSINKFYDFIISAPTVSFFQDNAGQYKNLYLMSSEIPNDPHNFFIMLFIFLGLLPALMIYMFIVKLLRYISLKLSGISSSNADFISLALFQVIIIFSLHPFNSFSRVFFSLMLGICFAFGKGKYLKKGEYHGK
ncbi:hypothetical protein [[Erwinia] mediterraneensis]|uniref:hypothetical protein n=1 Tax=[Erwinia] mediterraneensis TaxID=2161819 RepID=UPI00102FCB25|nr:hypothetical protein [[Erwinia] mediterraneensis]